MTPDERHDLDETGEIAKELARIAEALEDLSNDEDGVLFELCRIADALEKKSTK